jgi:anti-sigma B factor antagonist
VTIPPLGDRPAQPPGPGDAVVFFDEGLTLVLLSGEVDLALGDDLEFAGRDAIDRGEPIRIDLTRVTFMDSVGLGFLARLASSEREHGRVLGVAGAQRSVREAIQLVGLTGIVELLDPSSD